MNLNLPKYIKYALQDKKQIPITLFVDKPWYDQQKYKSTWLSRDIKALSANLISVNMKQSLDDFASFHAKMIIVDNEIAIFTTANISGGYTRDINQFYITMDKTLIRKALRWLNLYYHSGQFELKRPQETKTIKEEEIKDIRRQSQPYHTTKRKRMHRQHKEKVSRSRKMDVDLPHSSSTTTSRRHRSTKGMESPTKLLKTD